ncbi:hypothetical protein [uncultured Prevotella sp.]|uniref:hypothetical protein n=1 Tax=uncultured Prevotella sp. TaxID=159272 RepID=UPI002610BF97|nr:hypothetical protein [uncultured Prevotella sp.]
MAVCAHTALVTKIKVKVIKYLTMRGIGCGIVYIVLNKGTHIIRLNDMELKKHVVFFMFLTKIPEPATDAWFGESTIDIIT